MKVGVPAEVADVLRVEAVAATGLLDTGPEEPFERLAEMAARLVDAPMAVISLADSRRSFLKAAVGLPGDLSVRRQIPVEDSICPEVIRSNAPVVVEESARAVLGASAWIAVPVRGPAGHVLGALAVLHPGVRAWAPESVETVTVLADAVSSEIALRSHRATEEDLRLALAAGNMGMWRWDRATGDVVRDPALAAIYGLGPAVPARTFADWVALVHPDDRQHVLDAVEAALTQGGTYTLEHRIVRPDGSVRWVERRGQSFTNGVGEVAGTRGLVVDVTARKLAEAERDRLLAAEQVARRAAEEAAQRLAYLQAVTAGLAEARTTDQVAAVLVQAGAAGLGASSCAFCLVDEEDLIDVVGQVGYDPETIARYQRFPVDAPLPAAEAIRTGEMVLLASLEERDERFPVLRGVPALNQAFAVVPLFAARGPVGAIAVAWTECRRFTDNDGHFLAALGQHAAQALDRAQFYEGEREAAHRQAFLAEASRVLSTSLDYAETLGEVAQLAAGDIADSCVIHLIDDGELMSVAAAGVNPAEKAFLGTLAARLSQDETGEPLLFPSDGRPAPDEAEVRSAVAVPLRAQGSTLGVLALAITTSDRRFRPADLSFLEDLASRAAAAVANARSHQVRTDIAVTLQRSLLPTRVPLIPGMELAARYHPVGDESEVGGDFYDVFSAGKGRWGVVIGDVSGKGVRAASLTALARYTVRAAAQHEEAPSAVLAVLNDAILEQDVGERFATIAHASIEHTPSGATIIISRAGHPPPLLLRPDGSLVSLGRAGMAVGLFGQPSLFDDIHVLEPGEALVFYTDGLLEARAADGAFAEGLLEDTLAGCAGQSADEVADAIEKALLEFQGGRPRDDMALLVLRQPPGIFHRLLQPRPAEVTASRGMLRVWLEGQDPPVAAVTEDILLAASELATNAARAARGAVQLHAWVTGDTVTLDIYDDGHGFDGQVPPDMGMPDPWLMSGRGLYLVRMMMDECTVQSGPTATLVRSTKHV